MTISTLSAADISEAPITIVPATHALVYTLVMVSAADAEMSDNELAMIGDMVRHLPVFRGFDINQLPNVARECTVFLAQEDGMRKTLHLIAQSLADRLHETAYAIACDMAAADGSVSPEEMRLLEILASELKIDRLHAAAIERGARARYLIA